MKIDNSVFLENKYTKWYYKLISSRILLDRKNNIGIFHKHHIIPKSLGGSNKINNIVLLTPREHYICHLLLLEMTFGCNKSKMYCAFFRFNNEKYTSSRTYDFFIKKYSNNLKGENNPFYGKKHSKETKELISENHGMRGKYCYDIWLENYGEEIANKKHTEMLNKRSETLLTDRNGMRGKTHTDKTISKMKEARVGKKPSLGMKHSEETKKLYSKQRSGINNPNYGKKRLWINNGNINKCVLLTELNNYLNWNRGRI